MVQTLMKERSELIIQLRIDPIHPHLVNIWVKEDLTTMIVDLETDVLMIDLEDIIEVVVDLGLVKALYYYDVVISE